MGRATITLRQQGAEAEAGKQTVLVRELSAAQKLWNNTFFRKTLIIIVLAVAWELYARWLDNPLLFPTLTDTVRSFFDSIGSGVLLARAWTSIRVLLIGYVVGIVLAAVITILAISTRIGTDFLEVMTAMFNPLPAIALLPLALIWFGLGTTSIVFVLLHSVVWVVALNTQAGFLAVSQTLRMVGRNYELQGLSYVGRILIPAAFPSILTGLKIGWAFAWRTLIAAELVFGVASGKGGLGWFIFENRNLLDIPAVFAGLLTVIIIGLLVENFVFRLIEKKTVRRWGMQS
ncbi:ABC transporter permease [Candidimonas humi]|uniref:ABC transporter permease n=1 Tax=Candidimonas humi TaxID=683355 RepID=A0ABV8NYZ0_9BURK|nr:ABC transporter permease [Candidimonas humi]MBV6304287.1 ABC transporter permease [Candidimonas humi]